MENKLNITSTAIEKGIDLAKDFLGKLILPSIEETGLLLQDKVTLWRFNNQVKMLNKAQAVCEKHNIKPKTISLKLLCPLLDYTGLEENEILQDKWANLLTNMIDSEQNIENHVFPYLLSQISLDEFILVESVYNKKNERVGSNKEELTEFLDSKLILEEELKTQLERYVAENKVEKENIVKSEAFAERQRKILNIDSKLRNLTAQEKILRSKIEQNEYIPTSEIKGYEVSNLLRLGIIKNIPRPYAYVEKSLIKNDPYSEYLELRDIEITIDSEEDDLIVSQLGELFITACNEKKE